MRPNASLASVLSTLALVGLLPAGCADDISNPFDSSNETESEGDPGTTTGGDDDDDDTTGGMTAGTTMSVDDTAGTTIDETAGEGDDTTAGTTMSDESTSDSGGSDSDSSDSGVSESTTGEPLNHVMCPAEEIPNDMGFPVTVMANSSMQDSDFGGTCGGGGAPEWTFEFTAPMDGNFTFHTFGSTFDTVLYLLDDLCAGEELICDDDGLTGSTQSIVSATLTADQTITVVADSFGLSGGNLNLTVREGVACPVGNITTVPAVESGQTVATLNEFTGSCGGGSASDQAYLFTAPEDGNFTFEITNNDFNTVLYLLDGMCGGNALACNDNLQGAPNGASGLTFEMTMGQQITVVVDGVGSAFGAFDLDIGMLEGTCPDEDLGDTGIPFMTSGDTSMADNAAASSCGGLASPDYSYTWIAPFDGSFAFSTAGSAFDTVVHVNDGPTCDGAELGCNNDSNGTLQSSAVVALSAGQEVTITIDGNGASGAYDLLIDELNDCCFSHSYTGCADPAVENCVCTVVGDTYCCNFQWDSLCVNEAINDCMADCP